MILTTKRRDRRAKFISNWRVFSENIWRWLGWPCLVWWLYFAYLGIMHFDIPPRAGKVHCTQNKHQRAATKAVTCMSIPIPCKLGQSGIYRVVAVIECLWSIGYILALVSWVSLYRRRWSTKCIGVITSCWKAFKKLLNNKTTTLERSKDLSLSLNLTQFFSTTRSLDHTFYG